jgi:hypothetical protein
MDIIVAQPAADAETLPALIDRAPTDAETLPRVIDRAVAALSSARSSAEILEARELASAAYDAAARFAKMRHASDDVMDRARHAQSFALEIETLALRRLADEYDKAQQSGQVASGRDGSRRFKPTTSEVGLSHNLVYRSRVARDAELREPGITRRTLDAALAAGQEPTKKNLNRVLLRVAGRNRSSPKKSPSSTSGPSAVVKCRTALRALVQKHVRLLPTEADRLVLFGELEAELRRLKAAAAKPARMA